MREGAVINGVRYGPFICNIDKYQTRNTWVKIKMYQGKNREIRRIMQKNSLRVNRLKRLSYGPYTLFDLKSGEFRETEIMPEIKNLMYLAQRNKLKEKEENKGKLSDLKIKAVEGVKNTRVRLDNRKKLESRRSIKSERDVVPFETGFSLRS